jgi:hypothetical protein
VTWEPGVPTEIVSAGCGKAKSRWKRSLRPAFPDTLLRRRAAIYLLAVFLRRVPEVLPNFVIDNLVGQIVRAVGLLFQVLWEIVYSILG